MLPPHISVSRPGVGAPRPSHATRSVVADTGVGSRDLGEFGRAQRAAAGEDNVSCYHRARTRAHTVGKDEPRGAITSLACYWYDTQRHSRPFACSAVDSPTAARACSPHAPSRVRRRAAGQRSRTELPVDTRAAAPCGAARRDNGATRRRTRCGPVLRTGAMSAPGLLLLLGPVGLKHRRRLARALHTRLCSAAPRGGTMGLPVDARAVGPSRRHGGTGAAAAPVGGLSYRRRPSPRVVSRGCPGCASGSRAWPRRRPRPRAAGRAQ